MESLIKAIESLIANDILSKPILSFSVASLSLGVCVFYLIKAVVFIQKAFNSKNEELFKNNSAIASEISKSSDKINESVNDIMEKLKAVDSKNDSIYRALEKEIDHLKESSNNVFLNQKTLYDNIHHLEKDFAELVADSKDHYTEITRQIQFLQKDLASLHGTIIGLNTQRPRLK